MSARTLRAAAVLAAATLALAAAGPATARDHGRHGGGHHGGGHHGGGHHGGGHDYWENRRDARRVGVVAGAVAMGVTSAAANATANARYEDCTIEREYGGYPANCEQQRYYDQRNARRSAVVTGVVVGRTARAIAY